MRSGGKWIASFSQWDIGLACARSLELGSGIWHINQLHQLKRTQDFTVISSTLSPDAVRRTLCLRRAASRLRASTRADGLFQASDRRRDMVKIPAPLADRLLDAAYFPA